MNGKDSNGQKGFERKRKQVASPLRRIGYIVVIIIMFVILYLLRNYDKWGLYFLTEDFDKCLFYIELSIYANIIVNAIFLFYDNRWFRHFGQAATNVTGALSLIMLYVIYPISLQSEMWMKWIRIGLLVLFILTAISIITELIKGIRYLVREPEAV